jgi:hypothetical protein
MGFLSGRVTYTRYRVGGEGALPFGPEHLEQAEQHALGRHGADQPTDGVAVGWAGGDHVLDMRFDLEKNIVNDALHLGLRVDTDKIPGDLLRAYTKIELDARAAENPSGRPTKLQRQEAKEAARLRAEAESADGRFRRRKVYPVLWDGRSNILYAGTTTASVLDRLLPLFRETFDRPLEPITAGSLAYEQAEARSPGLGRAVEDFGPVRFLGDDGPAIIAWAESDASSRDFWGNEFLMWLWHTLQSDGDILDLPDGSDVSVMLAKTLTLDCPRGETGRDSLTNEGPARLPEAFRAIQSGKLPRKAGLVLVRHGAQYELTLQAETLAVSGLALPKVEGASGSELHGARIDSLRHLVETLDLLYDAYGRRRIGPSWAGELGRIRRWLQAA